jgi:hypothetical protein
MKLLGAVLVAIVVWSGSAFADEWTGAVVITSVMPLLSAEGGAVRVNLSAPVATSLCGTTPTFDLVLTGGTQASESALVAALYMAFATGKATTFLLSSTTCSPWSQPLVVGMNVSN